MTFIKVGTFFLVTHVVYYSIRRRMMSSNRYKDNLIFYTILFLFGGQSLAANKVYVDQESDFTITIDQGSPGLSFDDTVIWNGKGGPVTGLRYQVNAFSSIQFAIDEVSTGGTVCIAQGEYYEGFEIYIEKAITLEGDSAATTILTGLDLIGLITITEDAGVVILRDLGITRGNDSYGGGIGNYSTSRLDIVRCVLSDNLATLFGGGLGNFSSGTVNVFNSSILRNSCPDLLGGGIYNGAEGELVVVNSTIAENTTSFVGAGIYSDNSLTISNCTIFNNTTEFRGGGIYNDSETLFTLSNSIVAGNTKDSFGTISDNDIDGRFNSSGVNFIGNPSTNPLGSSDFRSGIDLSFSSTGTTTSNLLNPALADNGGGLPTLDLVTNSPALDAGSNSHLSPDLVDLNENGNTMENLPFDQRDLPRISGSSVDIGAIEKTIQSPALSPMNLKVSAVGETTISLIVENIPSGETFHVRASNTATNFTPLNPPVDFTSNSSQPFLFPRSGQTTFYQIFKNN